MTALLEILSGKTTLHRDALDLALELCLLRNCPGTALRVLGLANSAEIEPTLTAYKSVLQWCSAQDLSSRRLFTIEIMKAVAEAGLVPDLDIFVAAAEACSSAGDDAGALHFYDQADKLVSQRGSNARGLGPSQSQEEVGDENDQQPDDDDDDGGDAGRAAKRRSAQQQRYSVVSRDRASRQEYRSGNAKTGHGPPPAPVRAMGRHTATARPGGKEVDAKGAELEQENPSILDASSGKWPHNAATPPLGVIMRGGDEQHASSQDKNSGVVEPNLGPPVGGVATRSGQHAKAGGGIRTVAELKQELGQLCGAVWRSLGQHQTERAYQLALCMELVRRGVTVKAEAENPTAQYRGEYVAGGGWTFCCAWRTGRWRS